MWVRFFLLGLGFYNALAFSQKCTFSNECNPNEHCVRGECQQKGDISSRCWNDVDCPIGEHCSNGVCSKHVDSRRPASSGSSSSGGGGFSSGSSYWTRQEAPESRGNGSSVRITGDMAASLSFLKGQYHGARDFTSLAAKNRDFPCRCGVYNEKLMLFRFGDALSIASVKKPSACDTDDCQVSACQKNFGFQIYDQCEEFWYFYQQNPPAVSPPPVATATPAKKPVEWKQMGTGPYSLEDSGPAQHKCLKVLNPPKEFEGFFPLQAVGLTGSFEETRQSISQIRVANKYFRERENLIRQAAADGLEVKGTDLVWLYADVSGSGVGSNVRGIFFNMKTRRLSEFYFTVGAPYGLSKSDVKRVVQTPLAAVLCLK